MGNEGKGGPPLHRYFVWQRSPYRSNLVSRDPRPKSGLPRHIPGHSSSSHRASCILPDLPFSSSAFSLRGKGLPRSEEYSLTARVSPNRIPSLFWKCSLPLHLPGPLLSVFGFLHLEQNTRRPRSCPHAPPQDPGGHNALLDERLLDQRGWLARRVSIRQVL